MSPQESRDVVVTVPMGLWADWLREGDLPGQTEWPCFFCSATGRGWPAVGARCEACRGAKRQRTGEAEWHFYLRGNPPAAMFPGARCYVVAHKRLRGFAPITRIDRGPGRFAIVRQGDAVPCTIEQEIRGFQGVRYRSWPRAAERPFPDWQTAGVPLHGNTR